MSCQLRFVVSYVQLLLFVVFVMCYHLFPFWLFVASYSLSVVRCYICVVLVIGC